MSRKPRTLSEHESKALLAGFGVPLSREVLAITPDAAVEAATDIGFPVVLKLCGDAIAHKTERGLVRLGLGDAAAVRAAAEALLAEATPEQERSLRKGLAMGKFDQKWGSLPVALWLHREAVKTSQQELLAAMIRDHRESVLPLAARHIAPELRGRIEALMAKRSE